MEKKKQIDSILTEPFYPKNVKEAVDPTWVTSRALIHDAPKLEILWLSPSLLETQKHASIAF